MLRYGEQSCIWRTGYGTRLNLDASGNRTSADTVWNDTYSRTANQLVNGDNGPNPLAAGGGKSVVFGRPSYQNGVRSAVGAKRAQTGD